MNLNLYDDTFVQRHGIIQKPVTFFLLCFFTFGLYAVWWQFKVWRFLKEKEDLDIYPVARAIFSLFFIHSLLGRIDNEAKDKGHPGINSDKYAAIYIVVAIIGRIVDRLPGPISYVTLFIPAYIFLIPSLRQLNYYWQEEAPHSVPRTMSTGTIVLLIFSVLLFLLVILGILTESQS